MIPELRAAVERLKAKHSQWDYVENGCLSEDLTTVLSALAEMEKDSARLAFVAKHYGNAIHYCCRVDGDEWNSDFYGTLDRAIDRYAKRAAIAAADAADREGK
jgi:hypothetical protein